MFIKKQIVLGTVNNLISLCQLYLADCPTEQYHYGTLASDSTISNDLHNSGAYYIMERAN